MVTTSHCQYKDVIQDEQPILPGTDPEAGCMGSVTNNFQYYSSIINDATYILGTSLII